MTTAAAGGALSFLRRPAVRVPLLLALTVALGAWAARSCERIRQQVEEQRLAAERHARFMELLSRAARAAAGRPASLAELAPAIEALYGREYAARREFAACGPALGAQARGEELLWENYCYRLWPEPRGGGGFVIFAWPESPRAGRLVSAALSAEPGALYYTLSQRFVGPGNGPRPEDLGAEPLAGQVHLLETPPGPESEETALKRLAESDGRRWARLELK